MATISYYNHALTVLLNTGLTGTTFRVMLCTAATFNATHTTLAAITKTEITAANGYTAGGPTVAGFTAATVETNKAAVNPTDTVLSATGGNIAADFEILYLADGVNDPPIAFIDNVGTITASAGNDFTLDWPPNTAAPAGSLLKLEFAA